MKAMAGGGIYKYLQQVQGYLAPPITAVFLLGLFWKKTNATGAFVGLISGFILGILKLLIEAVVSFNEIQYGILKNIADFNFLYYSGILFLVSVIIMIITSIMTNNNQPEQTNGLSYDTLTEKDKREIRESWNYWDIIGTVIVLGCVLGIYIYFSYWL
jgi:SSS family solute:Na+ symporter